MNMNKPAPPPDTDAAHILVIDDDRRIRQLLQKFLSENGYRVTGAATAAEARSRMRGLEYDLLVLDVMMPGESGLEFATGLRRTSDVPVLMLTAMSEPGQRIEGLETGVDDYLPKPFEPRELLLRIGNILRRARFSAPEHSEIRMGDCVFIPARGELLQNGRPVRLTTREREILRIFASQPGKTFTRAELSETDGLGRERSIDVLINRLRQKIEPDLSIPVYIQTIRGAGYALFCD